MDQLGDAEPAGADQGGGRMIDRRLANIIAHCRHQLTNTVAGGLNSKIMVIKREAGGYHNVGNLKDVIYFYCGG